VGHGRFLVRLVGFMDEIDKCGRLGANAQANTESVESASTLVVDDDKLSRELLARRLQQWGHTTTVASDGATALKLLPQQPLDLVMLDISMPDIDGLQVLSVIRQTYSLTNLPVMMATAMDGSSDVVKAINLGANDYVTKPFDLPVVKARVEAQLWAKRSVDRMRRLEASLEQRNKDLEQANQQIVADNHRMQRQQEEVERLLDGVLTWPVARVLRETGSYPPTLDDVCDIATDIVGFSSICQTLPPKTVVDELNRFYKKFDSCCLPYEVEPLRSQGDSRIAIAGLHGGMRNSASIPVVDAILAMLLFRDTRMPIGSTHGSPHAPDGTLWSARIGIHCGPTMIGVMSGTRLFLDVWGNTVNIAARLEQGAEPNQIVVSNRVFESARGLFDHGAIGQMLVKNSVVNGAVITGIRPAFRDSDGKPNEAFWKVCRDPDDQTVPSNPVGSP